MSNTSVSVNSSHSSAPQITDDKDCFVPCNNIKTKKAKLPPSITTTLSSKNMSEVQLDPSLTLTSVGSTVCRICHTNTANEKLISPCNCKGTLAYVHLSCLERWLNQSSRSYCELCMYHYNSVQTLRYSFWEGILMWTRHPRNRMHVQSDVLIALLLTIVTAGLVTVCLLGMQYFVLEGNKLGVSKTWTKGCIYFFLGIVVTGYLITLYLVIRDQVVPWYTWWKNTFNVRLLLSPSILQCTETSI